MPNGDICSFASKYPQQIVSLSYIHSQVCCTATHPFIGVTAYEPRFAIMLHANWQRGFDTPREILNHSTVKCKIFAA